MNPHFWPDIPKPNFLQNWAVVSYGKSEGYKTNLDFSLNIPKPKTNPIQSQYKPNSNPIQTQYKPNTKPIKPNLWSTLQWPKNGCCSRKYKYYMDFYAG